MKSKTLQLSNVPEQDGWGIALSLVLHGLLLLAVILYQQFFISSRQVFTPSYQSVSLVGSAPTVQAPAPPKPTPAPPKPTPAPPKPTPTPPVTPPKPAPDPPKPAPTPPKPVAEPIKPPKPQEQVKPDSSRELEQRLQALQREQEQRRAREAEAERQRQQREAERLQQQALQESIARLEQQQALANAGSPGRAGSTPSELDPRLQAYNQQLHDLIHRNWVVPEGINTRGLVVVINFNIRRDGQAERIWIEQSSGNPVYDQSGLRAAEKATPFPPPPSVVRSPVYEVGIRFTYDG